MQRATQSAVGATASQTDANLPKPASLGMMAIWTATILLIVLVLFVVTAWYPRRRDGD
jgi:heme/copper-type cytochrome/quinol oxidase subunit 2